MRIPGALKVSFAVGILCQSSVHGAIEVLRGNLVGRVTTRAEADSNIHLDNLETQDFILTAVPEVAFKRDAALVLIDLSAGVSMKRFIEHPEYNDANPFASASVGWAPEGGKSSGQLLASAREASQANPYVNQRTVSDDFLVDGAFGHFVSEKFGYRLRANYSDQDFSTPGLSNVRISQAGFDARHQYSPKLETFVGYNFRENTTSHRDFDLVSGDTMDHQFLIGLDGELLPKVNGRIVVGTVTRRFAGSGESPTDLLLDSSIEWRWRQNITIALTSRRDFVTSPDSQSLLQSSFAVTGRVQMNPKIALSGEAGYSRGNYTGGVLSRSDRIYRVTTAYSYSFTRRYQGDVYASFRTSDSTSVFAAYNQVMVGVSFGLRL